MTTKLGVCVYCVASEAAIKVAENNEKKWEENPVKVNEEKCPLCGFENHWWYFRQ